VLKCVAQSLDSSQTFTGLVIRTDIASNRACQTATPSANAPSPSVAAAATAAAVAAASAAEWIK